MRRDGGCDGRRASGAAKALALGFALLSAGCSRQARPPAAPPPKPVAAPVAVAPATPVRPEGADGIDSALTELQLFNSSAAESLADIGAGQAKLRTLAAKAASLAKQADAAPPAQRAALAKRFTDTVAEREATHATLAASLDSFRTTLPQVSASADTAALLCQPLPVAAGAANPAPAPPVYEGCTTLAKEREALTTNTAALNKAFEAAEAAYRQDAHQLDEASATIALLR